MKLADIMGGNGAELNHRASLMKAAAEGDLDAQRHLMRDYNAWVYSPGERDRFMQRRENREVSR